MVNIALSNLSIEISKMTSLVNLQDGLDVLEDSKKVAMETLSGREEKFCWQHSDTIAFGKSCAQRTKILVQKHSSNILIE